MSRITYPPTIPAISGFDTALSNVLKPIKATIDLREGRTTSRPDRFISARDLEAIGIKLDTEYDRQPWTLPTSEVRSDDKPPAAPTNVLVAAVGMSSHRVSWVNPPDEDLYYIDIYRGTTSTFADADKAHVVTVAKYEIGQPMFRDLAGHELDDEYFYWLVAVDWAGNESDAAFVGSVEAAANPSIDDILATLTGDIKLTHLNEELSTPISAIPGIQSSLSSVITTVSTHTSQIASAQSTLSTHTNELGELEAEYFVKLDVNGAVSGFGIVNAAGTTYTIFRTDKFVVVNPASTINQAPFVVGTVAGVGSTVGINGALVVDGTVSAYGIATNAITATKINGGGFGNLTITSGSLTIQTSNGLTISGGGTMLISSGSKLDIQATSGITVTSGTVDFAAGTDLKMIGAGYNTASVSFYNYTTGKGSLYWSTASNRMTFSSLTDMYINSTSATTIYGGTSVAISSGTDYIYLLDSTFLTGSLNITGSITKTDSLTIESTGGNLIIKGTGGLVQLYDGSGYSVYLTGASFRPGSNNTTKCGDYSAGYQWSQIAAYEYYSDLGLIATCLDEICSIEPLKDSNGDVIICEKSGLPKMDGKKLSKVAEYATSRADMRHRLKKDNGDLITDKDIDDIFDDEEDLGGDPIFLNVVGFISLLRGGIAELAKKNEALEERVFEMSETMKAFGR